MRETLALTGDLMMGFDTKVPAPPAKPKRVCAKHKCETILSIWNDSEFCALHEPFYSPHMKIARRQRPLI